jgi:hypothetical protein
MKTILSKLGSLFGPSRVLLNPEDEVNSFTVSNRILYGSFETFRLHCESSFGGLTGLIEEIRIRGDRLNGMEEGLPETRVLLGEQKNLKMMVRLLRFWALWKPRLHTLDKAFQGGDEESGQTQIILKWMRVRGRALRSLAKILNVIEV